MTDPSRVRIGHAERAAATQQLREHHDAGRLTDAELDDLTAAAEAAARRGDLDAIFADLPGGFVWPEAEAAASVAAKPGAAAAPEPLWEQPSEVPSGVHDAGPSETRRALQRYREARGRYELTVPSIDEQLRPSSFESERSDVLGSYHGPLTLSEQIKLERLENSIDQRHSPWIVGVPVCGALILLFVMLKLPGVAAVCFVVLVIISLIAMADGRRRRERGDDQTYLW